MQLDCKVGTMVSWRGGGGVCVCVRVVCVCVCVSVHMCFVCVGLCVSASSIVLQRCNYIFVISGTFSEECVAPPLRPSTLSAIGHRYSNKSP